MNRIKTRLALLLAGTALASVFMSAPASAQDDTCHPRPQIYCWAMETYYECVIFPIIYDHPHCVNH